MRTVTVTMRRGEQDITVELYYDATTDWHYVCSAVDEDGNDMFEKLSDKEMYQARKLALAGVDETGR